MPNPAFRVATICDLDEGRLAAIGDEFGIDAAHESFDDLLADPAIDIIDICTPPQLHRPMVEAALAAGKHVVCEKPLTGSLADCRRHHRRREGREGRADADLPVPLRRRRREGQAHHRRRHRRQALRRQRRDLLEAHARLLRRALARQMGQRTRWRAGHPRPAPARHAAAACRPGRARVRPGGDPRQRRSRSRTAPAPAC